MPRLARSRPALHRLGVRPRTPAEPRHGRVRDLASAQHRPVGLIARLTRLSKSYVRQVIYDFNAHGLGALDPKWRGRPAKTNRATSGRITQIARCCPHDLGTPFSV
ncbi:helix-turn-helix domain-containing protein [Nocardia nova]